MRLMASIELIKGSDASGNANLATIQNTRSPGASTIIVDTVLGINPAGFSGTMGTPHTFTDPITSETITVISEASAVDFTGHVDGANLEIDDIAPGYTDLGSAVGDIVIIRPTTQWSDNVAEVLEVAHNDDGSLKNNSVPTAAIADDAVTAPKVVGIDKSNLTTDSNPYKFRVSRNAAANTGNAAFAVVAFDTEQYDTNNNVSAGVFTAPVNGFYQFNFHITINGTVGVSLNAIALFKNGVQVSDGGSISIAASTNGLHGSDIIQLTAGDTVDVRAYNGAAATALIVGTIFNNYFSGHLVSRT